MQVVIVGAKKIGKTQLANAIAGLAFDPSYRERMGITRNIIRGEKTYELVDADSYENYTSAVSVLFRRTNVVLLCFDPDNQASFEKVKEDFKLAKSLNQNCQFILVETRTEKLDPERNVSEDEISQFVAENKIHRGPQTDAETRTGINELKEQIQGIFRLIPKDIQSKDLLEDLRQTDNAQLETTNPYFWLNALTAVAAVTCIGLAVAAIVTAFVFASVPLSVTLAVGAAVCGVVTTATFFYRRRLEQAGEDLSISVDKKFQ